MKLHKLKISQECQQPRKDTYGFGIDAMLEFPKMSTSYRAKPESGISFHRHFLIQSLEKSPIW